MKRYINEKYIINKINILYYENDCCFILLGSLIKRNSLYD